MMFELNFSFRLLVTQYIGLRSIGTCLLRGSRPFCLLKLLMLAFTEMSFQKTWKWLQNKDPKIASLRKQNSVIAGIEVDTKLPKRQSWLYFSFDLRDQIHLVF